MQSTVASEFSLIKRLAFALLSAIILLEYAANTGHYRAARTGLSHWYFPEIYTYFKAQRKRTPVINVTAAPNTDIVALRSGTTSLRCNEPLFGYGLRV